MSTTPAALPFLISAEGNDDEMAALIESWRYRGQPTPWSAIVGHQAQIRRCQELVEKLNRTEEELGRLRIRVGAGLVITGPAGVGKTLLGRALASAAGRPVIVPPTAELTPALITRLYAQLAKAEPAVVILDEAEGIIGAGWMTTDAETRRALLAALDGVTKPQRGPITIALTTEEGLDEAATRPGRLAPRLVLSAPTAEERRVLLQRATADLPTAGQIDLEVLVERTATWTGAELVMAVEEACTRSLIDHSDALRLDLLLEVIGERYVVEDERPVQPQLVEAVAIHEAGHAVFGELTWPGQVAVMRIDAGSGNTRLDETGLNRPHDARELQLLAQMGLAGAAAEQLANGREATTDGDRSDRAAATSHLIDALDIGRPYDLGTVEMGTASDRGSERMRAAQHVALEAAAHQAQAEVLAKLAPHLVTIRRLAQALLSAPDQTLSGDELQAALAHAFGRDETSPSVSGVG
jgi:SpoVK/Ycf46/Vps4 family AAA+-type ATPase